MEILSVDYLLIDNWFIMKPVELSLQIMVCCALKIIHIQKDQFFWRLKDSLIKNTSDYAVRLQVVIKVII